MDLSTYKRDPTTDLELAYGVNLYHHLPRQICQVDPTAEDVRHRSLAHQQSASDSASVGIHCTLKTYYGCTRSVIPRFARCRGPRAP